MVKDTKRRTKTKELPKKERKLTAGDLKKVRGGAEQGITVNKPKTPDKALDKMDTYIRG